MRSHHDFFFFFNDTATTEIYTLSLHDALPISSTARGTRGRSSERAAAPARPRAWQRSGRARPRSEEHTSELQSRLHLVCRLLLEKKKKIPQQRARDSREHRSRLSTTVPIVRLH